MRIQARSIFPPVILCLAMLGIAGCCYDPVIAPTPASSDQQFIFEADYTNHAWGYNQSGIEIEKDGRVYRYEMSREKEWKPNANDRYTATELAAKYANNRTYVMTIPTDSLNAMDRLIGDAAKGGYSDTVTVGADGGDDTYSCWIADGDGGYRRLALRLRGDRRFDNLSPSAAIIADWLDTVWKRVR